MKLALALLLTLVAAPALAVVNIGMEGLISTVIYLIVIGAVFGILIFLVNKAPFIPAEWKQFIIYFIYFVGALFLINLLLGLAGHPLFALGR